MRLKSLAICLRGWREKEKSYVASDELVAYLARSPTRSQSLASLPLLSVLSCCALFFFFKFLIASDFQLLIADALSCKPAAASSKGSSRLLTRRCVVIVCSPSLGTRFYQEFHKFSQRPPRRCAAGSSSPPARCPPAATPSAR